MTQMPELVAILHSLVGLAAVLVGFANFLPNYLGHAVELAGPATSAAKTIHDVETYLGILIGAVTLSGSVIAFGKLSGSIGGKPLTLPARHWLNLGLLLAAIWFGRAFVLESGPGGGLMPLVVMTVVALLFGVHMVMAIGGADMPVVVSMLNSYSGWAASATGFMLSNDLLIVTGALVGSSGAILSYIMCRAMNRKFLSVIAGGFGTGDGTAAPASGAPAGRDAGRSTPPKRRPCSPSPRTSSSCPATAWRSRRPSTRCSRSRSCCASAASRCDSPSIRWPAACRAT